MSKTFCNILLLFLLMLTSCQETMEIVPNSLPQTRAIASKELSDSHYWSNGKKYNIKCYENKFFVLFHSNDQKNILDALYSHGIDTDRSEIKKYLYGGTDNSGEYAALMQDFYSMTVESSKDILEGIEDIAYIAPYFENETGQSFPLSNIIYLQLKNQGNDIIVRELMKKYDLGLIGKSPDIKGLYVLACFRGSKGNALDIVNDIYENEPIADAEIQPAFLSLHLHSADPLFTQQWNLLNTGQYGSTYAGIDINYQENEIPATSNIIVGVVDSGVQLDHPDLNICSYSWDSYFRGSPSYERSSHGTNVAGVISALNNSIGSVGIAPCVKVMSLSNIFPSENSPYSNATLSLNVAASINNAVDNGASVINCSWGGGTIDMNIEASINYAITQGRNGKGCVLVFSSGNDDVPVLSYPATHTPEDDVIVVGAITPEGTRKSYSSMGLGLWGSNYGSTLDIMAPGLYIPTTDQNSSWVTNFCGTSAAAPHVSAAAALILTINPNLSYRDVGYILERTANKSIGGYSFTSNKIGGTWNEEVGYGYLDLHAALSMARTTAGSITSFSISGPDMVNSDSNGFAACNFNSSLTSNSYTYIWTITGVSGAIDRWYLYPSASGFGSSAILNVYKQLYSVNSGMVMVTCRIYSGNTYLGSASKYVVIN